MPHFSLTALSACTLVAWMTAGVHSESLDGTWPQWRGPHRDSRVVGAPWPNRLTDGRLSVLWTAPQGPSYSGPIVTDDRVFVTETKAKKYEVVRALRRSTGEQIWETQWEGSLNVPFFAAANGSWIRSTPACDGERLYVGGMRDVLVCLDVHTGKMQWKVDFAATTGSKVPSFGFVSSPLILGEYVFVQAGASFAKLDKRTGELLWQTLKDSGGMFGSAFSSPIHATIAGMPQLVVQSRSKMAGIDAESGKVLWSQEVPAFRGMNILPPTVIGDTVFTSSYGGRSLLFRIAQEAGEWSVEEVWSHKAQGYMSSPVVIEGHIYLHLRNQRFTCLDAVTGAERWTTKPFGKYWSMVANGDKLLALDQRGELLLIAASPDEFKLVDRRKVADDSWAHLAVVNNQIFVRDLEAMTVFVWK